MSAITARRAPALLGAIALVAAAPRSATAEDPRRTVAVLEFRSESAALAAIGQQFAAALSARTSLQVLDEVQTRQRYGSKLDADIVRCGGEARCIGELGRRLETAEVLLVGVSQLGDVILTVQRIDSATGRVLNRLAEALPADAAIGDDELVTFLERILPAEDFLRYGTLAINVNVAGAEISVGGKQRGRSPLAALRVPAPSSYDIDVKKSGYYPFRAEVLVPPDSEIKVEAELTPVRSGRGPWYTRWWAVTAGGILVTGAATAGWWFTRDRDHVPASGQFE